ncbi:MAG: hypothetical protein QXU74_01115 [Candidatus Aenigmatarchaeota archaeon]
MSCPKFVDNTRECIKEIEFIPANTFEFCTTEKYKKCPFYLILSGDKNVCKNVRKCPMFKRFSFYDFKEFVEVVNKYCVSENHKNCKRFILKEEGKEVPAKLHPDGHLIEE